VLPPPTATSIPTDITIGNKPTHIQLSECSQLAQTAIQIKRLPSNLIHSCEEEQVQLDIGEIVKLITIWYGEGSPDDYCPDGCEYDRYVGVFVDNDNELVDLPDVNIELGMWGRPPFNEWRGWVTENHSSSVYQTVELRDEFYGWVLKLDYYKFMQVYLETDTSAYPPVARTKRKLYTASGEIFVYFDANKEEIWDYSRFIVETQDFPFHHP